MFEKFKSFLADDGVFYSLLLILVAVSSFGLGRQSGLLLTQNTSEKAANSEVTVLQPQAPQAAALTAVENNVTGTVTVVASKSGTKYHLPTCPGAKQIKPENLVKFTTAAEAEAAGYTPAANCKF